jgi:hypothetical protein
MYPSSVHPGSAGARWAWRSCPGRPRSRPAASAARKANWIAEVSTSCTLTVSTSGHAVITRTTTTAPTEAAAQPRWLAAAKRRANTRPAAVHDPRATTNPTPCRMPCQLSRSGAPAGAPGGKPAPASATKTPAKTSPNPKAPTSSGPQVPPRPGPSTRPMPTAQATHSRPVTTKLAIWIQPSSPRLSRLSGWRRRSNPSRVNAWIKPVARNSGPATTPQASSALVCLVVVAEDPLGASAPGVALLRLIAFSFRLGAATRWWRPLPVDSIATALTGEHGPQVPTEAARHTGPIGLAIQRVGGWVLGYVDPLAAPPSLHGRHRAACGRPACRASAVVLARLRRRDEPPGVVIITPGDAQGGGGG